MESSIGSDGKDLFTMKILHVTKKYLYAIGGDSTVVAGLENEQKKKNHKVTILTNNISEIKNKKNIIKFGLKTSANEQDKISIKRLINIFLLFFYSFYLLKEEKPDIIHSHSADLGFCLSIAARLYQIPVIHTSHGVSFAYENFNIVKKYLEIFFYKFSGFKKIITVDKTALESFKKVNINNVIFIPNGIDLALFKTLKKNKSKKFFEILFVGRLVNQKGISYLINACNLINKQGIQFKLNIVGEGEEEKKLKLLVKSLNLDKKIIFNKKERYDKIANYYNTADLFVLPSIWEGFPIVILEAWASQLPVISTNIGGIKEIGLNKQNMLLVPPKSSIKLSQAIKKIYFDDKLRKSLSSEGNRIVKNYYSWESVNNKILDIYKNL